MLRTLIFDWDGTLHNTRALYGGAFLAAYSWLVEAGQAPARRYTDEELSVYLGINAREMWKTFMPGLSQELRDRASAIVGERMVAGIKAGRAILYPGAEEALEEIKSDGYRLVFLSNCKRAYMEAHREWFGLDRYFDGFYCCEDYDFIPKKDIFPHVAETFPGDYLMIGDRNSDLALGFAHGLKTIACAYGFGAPAEWEGADGLARSVAELPGLVRKLA